MLEKRRIYTLIVVMVLFCFAALIVLFRVGINFSDWRSIFAFIGFVLISLVAFVFAFKLLKKSIKLRN